MKNSAAEELSIAVIGLDCRFPGAESPDELWRNLIAGEVSIVEADPSESPSGDDVVPAAAPLAAPELFDAAFFGVSPQEAELLDPQHRLFLESCFRALERAGYDPAAYEGAIGVFAGSAQNRYLLHNIARHPRYADRLADLDLLIASDKDHLPTFVSYKLDLTGPSVNVQTACSTSLVAVHLACRSLLAGDCEMALAGGVTVRVPHRAGYRYQRDSICSPDGRCRPFDAEAAGTVFGSGCGVVVLKRLADALADGDAVRAVVRGSAINNDGATKVGYTAPSVEGQAEVVGLAQAVAGIEPESIGYIEAHGTGTALGDPIEVEALADVFRGQTGRRGFCALGSVKANLGHLETAAGIAGLIKAVLVLEHGEIPGMPGFTAPNPHLDLERTPFYVPPRRRRWPRSAGPRRAGVSSFGIGGTNAHLVLEEAPPPRAGSVGRPWAQLLLSARSATALERRADDLAAWLTERPEADLSDVAFTLAVGRRAFEHRLSVLCRSVDEATGLLAGRARQAGTEAVGGAVEGAVDGEPPRPVRRSRFLAAGRLAGDRGASACFLFPGQGAQRPGMGRQLTAAEPRFRRHLEEGLELLEPQLAEAVRAYLSGGEAVEPVAGQLALVLLETALARLWLDWGVRPGALLGHSLGEYAAAAIAGVMTLEDALTLVTARGRLLATLPPGGMLAVMLPPEEIEPLLAEIGGGLALAAVNGEGLSVASGPPAAIDKLAAELDTRRVAHRPVDTDRAYHSPAVEPILEPFRREVEAVSLEAPALPLLSTVTGDWVDEETVCDAGYWVDQLRLPVRLDRALATLARAREAGEADEPGGGEGLAADVAVLLEIGPGRTLAGPAGRACPQLAAVATLDPAIDRESEQARVLAAVGRMWAAGVAVDWQAFFNGYRRRRVPLPVYPFEGRRYWIEPPAATAAAESRPAGESDLASATTGPSTGDPAGVGAVAAAESWRRAPEPAPPAGTAPGPWLVLWDGPPESGELASALADALADAGAEIAARAVRGDDFSELGDGRYRVDPGDPASLQQLLEELTLEGRAPEAVVALLGAGEAAGAGAGTGVGAVPADTAAIAGAVAAQAVGDAIPCWLLTRGGCAVAPAEGAAPPSAALAAAVRALTPKSGLLPVHLDLPAAAAEQSAADGAEQLAARLAALLLGATLSADGTVARLALRDGDVWQPVDQGAADQGAADQGSADRGAADRGAADRGSADQGAGEPVPAAPMAVAETGEERPAGVAASDAEAAAESSPEIGPAAAARRHPRPPLPTRLVLPRTDAEATIAEIWQELLGIDQVGVYDDFFRLGGHSLIGTQLVVRLSQAFDLDLTLSQLSEHSTVADVAEMVARMEGERSQQEQRLEEELERELLQQVARLSDDEAAAEVQRRTATAATGAASAQAGGDE